MNHPKQTLAAFTAATLIGGSALAAPVTVSVINPSFEDDDIVNNGFLNGVMSGWTTVGTATGTQDYASQTPQATDGEQHAAISFPAQGGRISQLTSKTVVAGETYTLKVDIGVIVNFPGSQGTIRLYGSSAGLGTPLSNTNGTAELNNIQPINGGPYLLDRTVTYTALASGDPFEGQQIGIAILNTAGTQILADNVRLDYLPVPEPSSLALLGMGGLLIARRRR